MTTLLPRFRLSSCCDVYLSPPCPPFRLSRGRGGRCRLRGILGQSQLSDAVEDAEEILQRSAVAQYPVYQSPPGVHYLARDQNEAVHEGLEFHAQDRVPQGLRGSHQPEP